MKRPYNFHFFIAAFFLLRLWHTPAQSVKIKSTPRGYSKMGVKEGRSFMLIPGGIGEKSPINYGDGIVEIAGHPFDSGMPSPISPPR